MNHQQPLRFITINQTVYEPKAHYLGQRKTGSSLSLNNGRTFIPAPTEAIYRGENVSLSATVLANGEYARVQNDQLTEQEIISLAKALASTFSPDGRWDSARTTAFSNHRNQMKHLIIGGISRFDGDKQLLINKVVNEFNNRSDAGKTYASNELKPAINRRLEEDGLNNEDNNNNNNGGNTFRM